MINTSLDVTRKLKLGDGDRGAMRRIVTKNRKTVAKVEANLANNVNAKTVRRKLDRLNIH